MSDHHEANFEPKPTVSVSPVPPWQTLFRGVALLGLAAMAVGGTILGARLTIWLALALLPITAPVAFLASWGALVQLSGGEKSDDHPWV